MMARLLKKTFKPTGCKTPRVPAQFRVPVRIVTPE